MLSTGAASPAPVFRERRTWIQMSILQRLRQKFGRAVAGAPRDLSISIEGQAFRFATPAEFEMALAPRTEVAASLLRRLGKSTEEELRADLGLTRAIHRKLTTGLLRSVESGVPISQIWREIDLGKIHEEHQWQELLYALSDPDQVADEYRRVALVKYLRYLNARRDTLAEVIRECQRVAPQAQASDPEAGGDLVPGAAVDDITYTSMQRSSEFSRLPPRHPVELVLTLGETVTMFLAHRRMRLTVTDDGPVLTDDTGLTVPIHAGKVVVGRSAECDVVLHNAPSDVSRKHLLIEAGSQEVKLTDLSSHGTYVVKRVLAQGQTRH